MVKIYGARLHGDRLRRLSSGVVTRGIMDAVVEGAELIKQEVVDSILDGAISGPGHVASLPGEPPNADTHELDQSIHVEKNESRLMAKVVSDSEKAMPLEFGTETVEERPHMRPAAQKKRPEARRLIAAAVNKANRGGF